MKNTEDRNIPIRNELDKLEGRIVSCEKRIFNQQPSTNESDENRTLDSESTNRNNQEPLMLMNQLKDWQSRQNNIITYNIPGSDLVNNNNIAADKLRKFQQFIAKQCSDGFRGVRKGRTLPLNFEQQKFFAVSIKR